MVGNSIYVKQGDILNLDGNIKNALVVSKNIFNLEGRAIVCPIVNVASKSPLHLPLSQGNTKGYILCEQLKYINLNSRNFIISDSVSIDDIVEISNRIESIFDYY